MQIVAKFKINPEMIIESHGLEDGGAVQKFIDQECIRLMDPYTPDLNGVLKQSVRINTVIGSGKLVQATPYARYDYYGVLFVDPITLKGSFYNSKTGRHWSRKGVSKIPDPKGRMLQFNKVKSPNAGPHWFERMVADHGDEIGRGAAKIAGGRFVK